MSTDARPSVGRSLAQVSAKMSVDYLGGVCRSSMSVEYVGRYVGRYSTDTIGHISADTRPISRSSIDRHYRPTSRAILGRHLGRYSTDTSADTRPTSRSTLGQDIDRQFVECDSVDSVGRYLTDSVGRQSTHTHTHYLSGHYTTTLRYATTLGRHSTDSVGRYSTDTLGRHLGRDVCRYLRRYSTDTRPTVSTDNRSTLDRHSTDTHPTLARHSPDTRPTLERHLGRYLTGISADTRPIVLVEISVDISADTRPILGRHSTDSVDR